VLLCWLSRTCSVLLLHAHLQRVGAVIPPRSDMVHLGDKGGAGDVTLAGGSSLGCEVVGQPQEVGQGAATDEPDTGGQLQAGVRPLWLVCLAMAADGVVCCGVTLVGARHATAAGGRACVHAVGKWCRCWLEALLPCSYGCGWLGEGSHMWQVTADTPA
jgi:hypothetical protein